MTDPDADEPVTPAESGRLAFPDPVVTTLEPLDRFYAAERYHQDYYARNGRQPYCQVVIAPKLAKFRQKFATLRA